MSYPRMPFVRRAGFAAACVLGAAVASLAVAQQDASRATRVAAVGQPAPGPVLNPRHPETYVVQRGDTLWDIAALFLRDPWYWPEIWQINPQVENPHLIFPGDVLSLAYLGDGRPVIQLERGPGGVERLSPRVRSQPLEDAISTIPYDTLRAFLSRPVVLREEQLETLPYVVAHREGLLGSAGRDVYVRGEAPEGGLFLVVHPGAELVDPDDGRVLGYEGIYTGQGYVRRGGDPSTVTLTESVRETRIGDYLLEEESVQPMNFLPRPPESAVDGRIISVIDGLSLIGQYQVVILNRGLDHGLEPGHVLLAMRQGEEIRDSVRGGRLFSQKVRLPDEPAGTIMVFRSFDRLSYALVMEATSPLRVLDTVVNP